MTGWMAGSGEAGAALGVGEGQELPEFLVGLEDLGGEVGPDLDRPGVLGRQQFSGRQTRPGWRACRVVCAGCAHGDLRNVDSWLLSVWLKSAMASSRSVPVCGWTGLAELLSMELVILRQEEGEGFEFAWQSRDTCSVVRSSSAAPAARSHDRHLTVGLPVTGRHPASRTGPERNMPAPLTPPLTWPRPGSHRRAFPAPWQATAAACRLDAAARRPLHWAVNPGNYGW